MVAGGIMNQRIILADNSYTIRRIVELSFQDIEDVELLSFENGIGLKDKLLELLPQVVLIDIKLPDFNGYEACKFINNEPSLVNTKVLLMKGGFEPIDEYLLKDLNYEDIITKPFDSKLLETQVIKLLKEVEAIAPIPPISVPEDLDMPTFSDNLDENIAIETNIETESFPDSIPEFNENQESEGISFSDVNKEIANDDIQATGTADNDMSFKDAVAEIETPEILSENELLSDNVSVMDEVEPSEEITQGAYEEPNDTLSSDPDDEFLNPFNDEPSVTTDEVNLKEHIKEHEEDLGIDSLTIEEMRIKSEIENRNKGIDEEEGDYGTDTFGGLEKQPDFDNISFDEDEEKEAVKVDDENVVKDNIVEEIQDERIDKSIFEAAEGILNDDISMLEEDTPEVTPEVTPEQPVLETEELPSNIEEPIMASTDSAGTDNLKENVAFDIVPEVPEVDSVPIIEEKIEEPFVAQEEIVPEVDSVPIIEEKIEEPFVAQEDIIKPEDIQLEEKIDAPIIEQEEITTDDEANLFEQKETQDEVSVENIIEEPDVEEKTEEPVIDEVIEKPIIEEIAEPVEPKIDNTNVDVDMEKVMASVEDKLTLSIKEILWEIIPPLAEKIIKEEIASLKSEIDNKEF